MKPTQIILTKGKSDCLPSAKSIPMGKEAAIPEKPTIIDSKNPPNCRDSIKTRLIGRIYLNNAINGPAIKIKYKKKNNIAAVKLNPEDSLNLFFARKNTSPVRLIAR